jgi:hypothetical protein
MIENPDFIGKYLNKMRPPQKTGSLSQLKKKYLCRQREAIEQINAEKEMYQRIHQKMQVNFSIMREHLQDFTEFAPEYLHKQFDQELCEVSEAMQDEKFDPKELCEFLDDWAETIELYSNPERVKEIQEAKDEYIKGECIDWQPGMFLKSS